MAEVIIEEAVFRNTQGRWVFIPIMLSFHFLSLVFMNIFFFDDMLVYLLLIDWSARFPSLRAQG